MCNACVAARPPNLLMSCDTCPFQGQPRVDSFLPSSAQIAFIGNHPGQVEVEEDKLFAGFSGSMLRGGLKLAGITCAYSLHNVLSCVPPRKATKKELKAAYKACKPRLHQEIHNLSAEIIVPLGVQAMRATGVKGSMFGRKTAQRGNNIPDHKIGHEKYWVFPTVHPSMLAEHRKPMWEGPFVADLQRVERALRTGKLDWDAGDVVLEPAVEDFERFVAGLTEGDKVAVDIETQGRGHLVPITCVGFSTGTESIVIPFLTWLDDKPYRQPYWFNGDWDKVCKLMQWIFDNCVLLMQNGKYDCASLEYNGFNVAERFRYFGIDTMLQAHVMCSDYPKDLSNLASYHTDSQRWKGMVDHGDRVRDHDWEINYRKYNAFDIINTSFVEEAQTECLEDEDKSQRALVYKQMQLQDVARKMGMKGVRIDNDRLHAHLKPTKKKYKELKAEFLDLSNGVSPGSPKQLAALFYDKYDIEPYCYTPGGAPSVNKDALSQLSKYPHAEVRTLANLLLEYRKYQKVYSTFLKPFQDQLRIYPYWNVAAAQTGRWSCSMDPGPSLQTLPHAYRDIFIPEVGEVFIAADWSQLEMRIIAYLAGCELLIENCETGDPHAQNSEVLFGAQPEDPKVRKRYRTLAKNFWYGQQYEGGLEVIYRTLTGYYDKDEQRFLFADMTRNQIRIMLIKVKKMFPELDTFKDWYYEEAKAKGYAWTFIHDRRRYFLNGFKPTEVKNLPIQGTAADMCNDAVERVDLTLPDQLTFQMHDELVIGSKEDDVDADMAKLVQAMEHPVELISPFWRGTKVFPTDPTVGNRLSEL